MAEGQNQIYLRRLQTGKHLLDQKVGKLSAVGSVPSAPPGQPSVRNGAGNAIARSGQ